MNANKMLLATILMIAGTAWAGGDKAGNGGDAVVCRDESGRIKSAEFLDLWEAKKLYQAKVDLPRSIYSYLDEVEEVATRLERYFPRTAADLRSHAASFERDIEWSDAELVDIPDAGDITYPSGCKVEQVIIRRTKPEAGQKRFVVSRPLWAALDFDSKAVAVLHEFVYGRAIDHDGHANSMKARLLNVTLMSKEFDEPGGLLDWVKAFARSEIGFNESWGCYSAVEGRCSREDSVSTGPNSMVAPRGAGLLVPLGPKVSAELGSEPITLARRKRRDRDVIEISGTTRGFQPVFLGKRVEVNGRFRVVSGKVYGDDTYFAEITNASVRFTKLGDEWLSLLESAEQCEARVESIRYGTIEDSYSASEFVVQKLQPVGLACSAVFHSNVRGIRLKRFPEISFVKRRGQREYQSYLDESTFAIPSGEIEWEYGSHVLSHPTTLDNSKEEGLVLSSTDVIGMWGTKEPGFDSLSIPFKKAKLGRALDTFEPVPTVIDFSPVPGSRFSGEVVGIEAASRGCYDRYGYMNPCIRLKGIFTIHQLERFKPEAIRSGAKSLSFDTEQKELVVELSSLHVVGNFAEWVDHVIVNYRRVSASEAFNKDYSKRLPFVRLGLDGRFDEDASYFDQLFMYESEPVFYLTPKGSKKFAGLPSIRWCCNYDRKKGKSLDYFIRGGITRDGLFLDMVFGKARRGDR